MSLEAATESASAEGAALDSEDLLSRRQNYVDSDPVVQALGRRVADLQADLAVAREREPNDAATLQRRQKVLDTLDQQIGKLRQARRRQFEEELAAALQRQGQQHLAKAKLELQQTRAYEEHLRQALKEQEPKVARAGSTNLDVQDGQFRLQLDQELYDKICRRIQQMEMESRYPSRVEIAYMADVAGTVDHHWQWTLIMLGATLLLSIVLLIARRVVRPRPPMSPDEGEKVGR